jgi:hypothetical protein
VIRVVVLKSRVRTRLDASRVPISCLYTVRMTLLSSVNGGSNPQVPSLHHGEVRVVAGRMCPVAEPKNGPWPQCGWRMTKLLNRVAPTAPNSSLSTNPHPGLPEIPLCRKMTLVPRKYRAESAILRQNPS